MITVKVLHYEGNDWVVAIGASKGDTNQDCNNPDLRTSRVVGPAVSINQARTVQAWLTDGGLLDINLLLQDIRESKDNAESDKQPPIDNES